MPGVFLAGAVLTRYEGLAAALVISLAAAFVVSSDGVDTWSARSARILTTGIAPLSAFAFWLAVQWQIVGDPLYFINTSFSGLNFPDTARQAGAGHLLFGGMGSISQTLVLAAERAANLSPAYVIAAIALGVLALWKRDRIAWILLLSALSVPAFHAFQVFTGRLGPYTRYWIDFVPWAIPMLGYLVALLARDRRRRLLRNGATLVAVALLALSAVTTVRWMYSPPPEFGANFYDINELYVTHFWFQDDRLDQIREATKKPIEQSGVAEFLDQRYPDERILIDQWHGHPIILQLADPTRVVMTNDRDFFEILEDPVGRVDLFAVAKFDGVSPHVIESAYPGIWQFGRPWLELEAEVGRADSPWRIFRVKPAP